jgi:hypothetical protein
VRTRPVTGHSIARKLGLLALSCLGGALATLTLAAPAYAEDADLRLEIRTGQLDLVADGDPQTLTVAVINDGPSPATAPVANFEVPMGGRGVTIGNTSHSCAAVNGPSVIACQVGAMNPGQTIDVTVELKPPGEDAVQPGENVSENGNAWVSNPAGGDPNNGNDGGSFNVTLTSEEQQGSVSEVSGTVVDGSSGQPIEGATVEVKDNADVSGTATTDAEGRFTYRAEQEPLLAGRIRIRASKDGYQPSRTTIDANGNINDVQLALSLAAPTPTVTPTAVPTSAAAQSPAAAAPKDDDDSSLSLIVVVLVSVVATAILTGAGLWIGLRRNRDNEPAFGGIAPGTTFDAPTVQLRLDGVGGGTQLMPGLPNAAVDATQQIPQPNHTQLMPPRYPTAPLVEYDETAPFGPPPTAQVDATARYGPATAPFGQPPAQDMFAPRPDATARMPSTPAPDGNATAFPPASAPPFPPTSAPPFRPTSAPPAPPFPPTSAPPAAPLPPTSAPLAAPFPPAGPFGGPPAPISPADPFPPADDRGQPNAPASPSRYRGPLDPPPPNSTILRITPPSTAPSTQAGPSPSPLSTQGGALPPITALQAPGSSPRREPSAGDNAPPGTGRHGSGEIASDSDAPPRGRHSGPA